MKLYEFCVIYRPAKEKDVEQKPVLLVDVTRVLAGSEKEAGMMAARAIPESHADKLDRLEIALRPF